ncbi:MAG: hypothetical protein RL219_188 [Actinomycetota bacterium]
MTTKSPLTDFAKANPAGIPGSQAWIETIPEFSEVLEGWKAGISQGQIRRWLIEVCGYDPLVATRSRIAHLSKTYPRTTRG